MKKLLTISVLLTLIGIESNRLTRTEKTYEPIAKTGDLIFQTEVGRSQAHAIQAATFSPYNHVGVVVEESGKLYVYEAHGPVKKISLSKYVNRKGTGSRFVVYRHEDVDKSAQSKIKTYVRRQVGKPYDSRLSWGNSSLYCSELAYKALGVAKLDLEEPPKMKDMKVPLVIGKIIPNGYKLNSVKMDDFVIAPSHLTRDKNIYKVYQNW